MEKSLDSYAYLITVDIGRVNMAYCVVRANTNSVLALEQVNIILARAQKDCGTIEYLSR